MAMPLRFFLIAAVIVAASARATTTATPTDRCSGALSNGVLLVEDDRAVGPLLHRFLELGGFEPVWATDTASALAAVASRTFRGAFVDLNLGTESGAVLAQRLHDEFGLPIIILSGSTSDNEADVGFPSAGKPLGMKRLVELAQSFASGNGT